MFLRISHSKLLILTVRENFELILILSKREILSRYKGSAFGLSWSLINPLVMLVIYTLVFSIALKARWGIDQNENLLDFAIILFVGLMLHGFFAECINQSHSIIYSNVSYVKKIIFPLEVLPIINLISAFFNLFISFNIIIFANLMINQSLHFTVIVFPIIILPLVIICLGLSWLLAAVGVYFRDVGQLTGILTTALLFISGVFFPITILPEKIQFWFRLNPLAIIIEQSRQVLFLGQWPDFVTWLILMVFSLVVLLYGFSFFLKVRKGFADVI